MSEDSNPGDPNDPRSLNYYTYCYNNPLGLVDPDGHAPIAPFLAKAGVTGAADFLLQASMNYYFDSRTRGDIKKSMGSVNWGQVARSSVEGLIPWKIPGGRFGKAAISAAADVLANNADSLMKGTEYSQEQALQDFTMGFIGDLAGGGVGELIDKYGTKAFKQGLEQLGMKEDAIKSIASKFYTNEKLFEMAEKNLTNNGKTVLGHFDGEMAGYIGKAKQMKASYFSIGDTWDLLTPDQRKAANMHFLDVISERGDQVYLSVAKKDINPGSSLAAEIEYLTKEKKYVWINQWSLVKKVDE